MENDCLLSGKHKSIDFTKNIHFEICKRLLYLVEFLPLYWGGVWRTNNYSSVKERRFWGVGLKQHFFPIDLFFTHWKKKHKSAHEKEKTYRWRKKKFTSKLKNPKKCLLRSQDMSIKTKKWSEQSERVCVKTTFPFVKVKHKVKKWLSLVTFMFNGENNTGL